MTFRVLTAHGDDGKAWDAYVQMLPFDLRDVHFSSAWGRLHETRGGTAHLAVWEDDGGFIVCQPFMLKPIRDGLTDTAAVGYGGPLTSDAMPSVETVRPFAISLNEWRWQQQVVSDFYLINPSFAEKQWLLVPSAMPIKPVVALPVGDGFLERMTDSRRQALTSASKKAVVNVTGTPSEDEIAAFAASYAALMDEHTAGQRWRYDLDYFKALFRELNGFAVLASAKIGDDIAYAIFILGRDMGYYYLAAHAGSRVNGLGDVVITLGEGVARRHGCTWLHLGGGVSASEDDPLFRYKRSFGGLVRPVFGVPTIVDHQAYARLTEEKGGSFFPAYRAGEA